MIPFSVGTAEPNKLKFLKVKPRLYKWPVKSKT